MDSTTRINFAELLKIPLPEQTDTYMPVSHTELINKVVENAEKVLHCKIIEEDYTTNANGNHLFARLIFNIKYDGLSLCIGLVNSYDKRLRVRIAVGVFVEDNNNIAIRNEITYARKHTPNAWIDIEKSIQETIIGARRQYEQTVDDARSMALTPVTDDQAFQIMGLLYGRQVLHSQMLSIAHEQWMETHLTKRPTLWSLYNNCATALRTARADVVIEKHRELHELLSGLKIKSNNSIVLPK